MILVSSASSAASGQSIRNLNEINISFKTDSVAETGLDEPSKYILHVQDIQHQIEAAFNPLN